MARHPRDSKRVQPPYSLSIEEASPYFGLAENAFHRWIRDGRLQRDYHYLEVRGTPVIIREAFIEFMKQEDAAYVVRNPKSTGRESRLSSPGSTIDE